MTRSARSRRLAYAGFAALAATHLLPWATPALAADRDTGLARMVGVWQLDTRSSDDPLRALTRARLTAPPPLPSDRRGDEAERPALLDALQGRVEEVVRGDSVLTFTYASPNLQVTYWDDRRRAFTVDGRPEEVATEGGSVRQEVEWIGSDRLRVKTDGGDGKRIEIYELGDRGDKLFVTVEIYRKGLKRPFSFDRVYHRVTASD
jgi:hypothetical protein